MKKPGYNSVLQSINDAERYNRRRFLEQGISFSVVAVIGSGGLLAACGDKEGEDKEVSPPEDLMQEHGLLNRILLIYDHCIIRLSNRQDCNTELIGNAAGIIRTFVEDYHEKQEENYLFPRFEKAGQLSDLVSTLRTQHQAGRMVTEHILQITRSNNLAEADRQQLLQRLSDFVIMYRPHESREDTILFPAFRKLVSKHEYDALGEEFENNERRLFGEDGFDVMVAQVETIERAMGIYDLAQFTPKG